MNTDTLSPPQEDSPEASQVHSVGGLVLAGWLGGPLAIVYLIHRDLKLLGLSDRFHAYTAWFWPLTGLWFYSLFSVAPDLISEWIAFLPQVMLWWVLIRRLHLPVLKEYRDNGGLFRSRWAAVRVGLLGWLAFRFLFFLGQFAYNMWPE